MYFLNFILKRYIYVYALPEELSVPFSGLPGDGSVAVELLHYDLLPGIHRNDIKLIIKNRAQLEPAVQKYRE